MSDNNPVTANKNINSKKKNKHAPQFKLDNIGLLGYLTRVARIDLKRS
ncbi:MAG: hypothetical protein NT091_04015 [Candidatus Falkowbacteria bacterium]|nr:hypothetical protein [Candidatus Falkowbacteria bacterium]